jgi:hypothetical protein
MVFLNLLSVRRRWWRGKEVFVSTMFGAVAPTDPLAVDGKTLRGARTAEGDAPHLLSCFTHQSQEVWAELAVGEKTNEIPFDAHPPRAVRLLLGSLLTLK